MALTAGLNMAIRGMMTTAVKTTLSSQNITNADKTGYSRKELQVNYLTTNTGSTPVAGIVVGTTDKFMVKALVGDISTYSAKNVVSSSLDYYVTQVGNTDGTNSLSNYLDSMYSTLQYLATNPETNANKSEVVQTADGLASSLRDLTNDIQKLRLQNEQKIADSVNNINAIIDRINTLNEKITGGVSGDSSTAEYEDQRNLELQNLAGEMDIQYFYTANNRLQLYTGDGQALLLSQPQKLTYAVTNQVNSTTLYPADFSPISLNGADITNSLRSGKLAGYIDLRDDIYPKEQAKLDEFANVLKNQINTLLNTGASVPSRNIVEGSLKNLTAGTTFSATGTVRVAVTDRTGTIVNYSDINLSSMTNINDVMTALNGIPGVTASLNTDGQLKITATPSTNGISINPMTSSVTSSTGESFSSYFGLNDLFTGTAGASDIKVSNYLLNAPEYLAIGVLSSSATLAVGDRGVNRGDGSIAQSLSDMLNSNVPFNAAGDFAAQNNTLQRYAQAFMSSAASKADLAQKDSDTSLQVYKTSSDLLTSHNGVNVDEETAKLLVYQNQYQAGAQVVKTIQEMLDALIAAIR
ncbi:MAG TPA: flagellar hook-associated protein FlgK [Rhodospirillaceae bacterium]|nr:flagellar hook-associated protein FlgK [Rhodospirillaceae bacterium]